jgi:hypothetical protein
MNKPVTSNTNSEALDLTVRFVGGPPIDELVYWIRRCAEGRSVKGPLTVVLETTSHAASRRYEVRLERPDRILATERDVNAMLAVRNAFERLPSAGSAGLAHSVTAVAAAPRTRAAR